MPMQAVSEVDYLVSFTETTTTYRSLIYGTSHLTRSYASGE